MLTIDGVVRPLLRPVKRQVLSAYKRLERNMFGHPDAHWTEAPPSLSLSTLGKDTGISRFDQLPVVKHYVRRPGILRMRAVSLTKIVQIDLQNPKYNKKYRYGLVDRWGFPLSYIYDVRGWEQWISKIKIGPSLKISKSRKTVAFLGEWIGDNYFHWLTDVVGDYWFIINSGVDIKEIDLFVYPGGNEQWQHEILSIIGIPEHKRISINDIETTYGIDALFPYRSKASSYVMPTWISTALRETLGYDVTGGTGQRRLYLSRKDAKRRRIINESEIRDALNEKGFTEVQCEGMTFNDQKSLFGNAEIIVAAHGASLTNIIWCKEGTKIIDILPDTKSDSCFGILSHQCKLAYYPVWTKAIKNDGRNKHWDDILITKNLERQIISLF